MSSAELPPPLLFASGNVVFLLELFPEEEFVFLTVETRQLESIWQTVTMN